MHDDDNAMAYCPSCGREVFEFAEKCPHCGDWITPTYRSPRGLGWHRLVIIVVVALLVWALLRRYL